MMVIGEKEYLLCKDDVKNEAQALCGTSKIGIGKNHTLASQSLC